MNGASLRHRFGLARRSWFIFFACLLASLAPSCGDPEPIVVESPEIAVLVTVEGLTPEITSLFMTTTLAGKPAQQGHEFTGRLDQLAVYLPRETSGLLNLRLVGRSSERCLVASGEAQVSVVPAPPTRYDVKITLAAAAAGAPKACALTVLVKGKGSVESTPPGISCVGTGPTTSQCSYDFAVGSQISLSATADAKSIGVLWGGDCSGTAACSFTHNKPTNITADFAPRICSPNNWCWYAPLPQGSPLRGMWGSSAKDIWAVGDFGTILHYKVSTVGQRCGIIPQSGVAVC